MSNLPISWQKVAGEYLHHPEPESAAARQLVRRMVRAGMPCVPGRAGGLFFGDQVAAWLRRQAETGADLRVDAGEERPRADRTKARARKDRTKAGATPLRDRVRQLRLEGRGRR